MTTREDPEGGPATSGTEAAKAAPQRVPLRDRIADLQLGARAKAVSATIADRVKAVQAAAPAPSDIKLNRETLKAGRDSVAAKVEALLKARPVDDAAPPVAPSQPSSEPKPSAQGDIQSLKARLDDALRTKGETPDSGPVPPTQDALTPPAAGTTAKQRTIVIEEDAAPPTAPTTKRRTGLTDLFTRRATTAAPAPKPFTPDVTIAEPITTRTTRTQQAEAALDAERRRPLFSWSLLLTAIAAGGVLHVLTTFAVPALNSGSAFNSLRFQLEANAARVFPADADGKTPLPFLTADVRYAMCRYDLTQGPVQVSAILPDIGWSLTLYTPQGDNFYAVPGQDGRQVTAAFSLNTASDRLLLPVPGMRRTDTDAALVTSPQREGLVIVRAPYRGPAYQAILEDGLKRLSCRAAPRR